MQEEEKENYFQMIKEENILDSGEIVKFKSEGRKLSNTIGICFLLSLPIVFFLTIQADDHGLFLPRSKFIDSIIPESLIYLKNGYEIRLLEETISLWILFYFTILGIFNLIFWRSSNKEKLRIGHVIVTIGFAILFLNTMVEDDIFHELKIRNPIGKKQYENKIMVFYQLFIFWIGMQIVYFTAFFKDLILILNRE